MDKDPNTKEGPVVWHIKKAKLSLAMELRPRETGYISTVVFNWGVVPSQRTLGNVWRYFWLSHWRWGAAGRQWVEATNATQQPIMDRKPCTTKKYLAANVNSAETEKPFILHPRLLMLLCIYHSCHFYRSAF